MSGCRFESEASLNFDDWTKKALEVERLSAEVKGRKAPESERLRRGNFLGLALDVHRPHQHARPGSEFPGEDRSGRVYRFVLSTDAAGPNREADLIMFREDARLYAARSP